MKTNICDCIGKIALTFMCTISSVVAAPIEGMGRPDDSIIEQVVTVGTRVPVSSMLINGSVASLHDDELSLEECWDMLAAKEEGNRLGLTEEKK